jgi:hypothetical protein
MGGAYGMHGELELYTGFCSGNLRDRRSLRSRRRRWEGNLIRTVLYCTVLYCTVLYCTVLYCTVLYCTVHLVQERDKRRPLVNTVILLLVDDRH